MRISTYRLNSAIPMLIRDGDRVVPVIHELAPGSELVVADTKPDHEGMIVGTCEGKSVRVFLRDLHERAEVVGLCRTV